MKALTFFLSLLMTLGLSSVAEAQYTRNNYEDNRDDDYYASNTSSASRYGDTRANTRTDRRADRRTDRRLDRRQRVRYQRELEDRASDQHNWSLQLDRRIAIAEGRRVRPNRAATRYRAPNRLLRSDELYAWDKKLVRQATLLQSRERRVQRLERQRRPNNRNRNRNRNRGRQTGGGMCPPGW